MGTKTKSTRPRCFFVFNTDTGSSITLVFELNNSLYPRTIENFLKLCTGDNNLKLSYKKSQLTRIISPEFIIQGGLIRRKAGSPDASILKSVVDIDEYQSSALRNNEKLSPGDLCLIDDDSSDGNIPENSKCEFFIPLRNLSKYPALTNRYMVIGKLVHSRESLESLIDWSIDIPVDDDGYPLTQTYISRVGKLVPNQRKDKTEEKLGQVSVESQDDKVNLFDAIFGSKSNRSRKRSRI